MSGDTFWVDHETLIGASYPGTSRFVMRSLGAELHFFQGGYDDPARPLSAVDRNEVEIATGIQGPGRGLPVFTLLEDKKLHLAPDPHREAQRRGSLDLPLQRR